MLTERGPIADVERFEDQYREATERSDEKRRVIGSPAAGYYEAAMWPERFDRNRFPLDALQRTVVAATVEYHVAGTFLSSGMAEEGRDITNDGIEAVSAYGGSPRYTFWQVREFGFLYHRSSMPEDGNGNDAQPYASIDQVLYYVAQAVDCLGGLYTARGVDDEGILLRIGLIGTDERRLRTRPSRFDLSPSYRARIPFIRRERALTLSQWVGRRDELILGIAREVLLRFNPVGRLGRHRLSGRAPPE